MKADEAIAKWIEDNASNIDAGYLTENRSLGARRILDALAAAGYAVIKLKAMAEPYSDPDA